jgi:hypothetical protein
MKKWNQIHLLHIWPKNIYNDYTSDFMKKSRREKLMQLCSVDPKIFPMIEVKPLK